jgi:hypothetical protein
VTTSYSLNQIDDTARMEDLHLRWDTNGYAVYVLGKAGEARPFRQMYITMEHSHITPSIDSSLQTDFDGRILLGHLPGITRVSARTNDGQLNATWYIDSPQQIFVYPQLIHAREGDDGVRLPYHGRAKTVTPTDFSLYEQVPFGAGGFIRDLTATNLRLNTTDSSITVTGLKV